MRRVILESPYAGKTDDEVARNVEYAKLCLADCLVRNEAPIASHLLYTLVLDDKNSAERDIGLRAGWAWMKYAQALVVYQDRGVSSGMQRAIDQAADMGKKVEYRNLEGYERVEAIDG